MASLDPESLQMTTWLENNIVNGNGWGLGRLQTDDSLLVLNSDCNTRRVPFNKKSTYYEPACDTLTDFPIPDIGGLEGHTTSWLDAAACSGDCHLLVHDVDSGLLWESFDTSIVVDQGTGLVTSVSSTCAVVWNTTHLHPSDGRGDGCTSADAAGFPISTLLWTPEEIQAGSIDHAIRFILPNNKMRANHYANPASHFGGPSAPETSMAPIYGSRWRLKASYNIDGYSQPAQVVLKALKTYGMFLSDGGNVALTKASDTYRSVKWDDVGLLTSRPFDDIRPSDFEVVAPFGPVYGRDVPANGRPDCVRNTDIPIDTQPICPAPSDPTASPTIGPTTSPTAAPFISPTVGPTNGPTSGPVGSIPTASPTTGPTAAPFNPPTVGPTNGPTSGPAGSMPTASPTNSPTSGPTVSPTVGPTTSPTFGPTTSPTNQNSCVDDDTWKFGRKQQGCDHVALRPNRRCNKVGTGGVLAYEACPVACGTCPEATASSVIAAVTATNLRGNNIFMDPGQ